MAAPARRGMQTEVDASYLYERVAAAQKEPELARVFRDMSAIERSHAEKFKQATGVEIPRPSWRARLLDLAGRVFGYEYVVAALLDVEKSISGAEIAQKNAAGTALSGTESNHVRILSSFLSGASGQRIAAVEGRHKSIGGNALRAGVLGSNDGLLSNLSLVMGVVGASGAGKEVLIAGLAGLLAGGFSMALGEWISVRSSQELNERQMEIEMEEIQTDPEGERRELELIYMAKGISPDEAKRIAADMFSDTKRAHAALVEEELGLSVADKGSSPWVAAIASFILFVVGAMIPVAPFIFWVGNTAITISIVLSTIALFAIGAVITLFTGKNAFYSGLRQILFGLAAALVTYGVGAAVGTAIA